MKVDLNDLEYNMRIYALDYFLFSKIIVVK